MKRLIFAALGALFMCLHPTWGQDVAPAPEQQPISFNYALVGVAQFDGVSYASLVERETGFHFVLISEKPTYGMALVSVTADTDPSGASAVIQKDGASLLLRVESIKSVLNPVASEKPVYAQVIARGIFDFSADNPKAPTGESLPLVFQSVDPKKLVLTEEQKTTLAKLREEFVKTIHTSRLNAIGSQAANDQSANLWRRAQSQSDEQFKIFFGTENFNAYQVASTYQPIAP